MGTISEALPALGICAAVLGIVKAMGALDQSPEILGEYIGAALIGTLTGIFWSYAVVSPLAQLIKTTREKQMQSYIIVKQTIIAFMNGALPQIALEHGRKTISSGERPTIDEVESEAISNTPPAAAGPEGGGLSHGSRDRRRPHGRHPRPPARRREPVARPAADAAGDLRSRRARILSSACAACPRPCPTSSLNEHRDTARIGEVLDAYEHAGDRRHLPCRRPGTPGSSSASTATSSSR